MATTSKTLSLNLSDASASLNGIWDSVVEKMNSRPGTPRGNNNNNAMPTKPTIKLLPESPGSSAAQPAARSPRLNTAAANEEEHKIKESSSLLLPTLETSRDGTSDGPAKDIQSPVPPIEDLGSKTLEEVKEAEKLSTTTAAATPLNSAKEERKSTDTPMPVITSEENTKDMGDSRSNLLEEESKNVEAIAGKGEAQAIITPQSNGLDWGKGGGQEAAKTPGNLKLEVKKHLEVPADPETIPLPNSPIEGREGRTSGETRDLGRQENADTTEAPVGPKDEKDGEDKKGLQIFTKLKRKLSTNHMRERKQSSEATPQPPLPQAAPYQGQSESPITLVESPQHIEMVKTKTKTPPTSAKEPKKSSKVLFKSIRAAMKFSSSGKSSAKSPTISKPIPSPLQSPVSPRKAQMSFEKSSEMPSSPVLRKSTSKTEKPTEQQQPTTATRSASTAKSPSKPLERKHTQKTLPRAQPSVRRPGHNATGIKPALRPRQTWSPASSNPILASNPNAKLYTIWPRYPVVEAQTDEIQAVLEGFLLNEKDAIEKSCAAGSLIINFWKAPLTSDQAAVVQGNKFVSAIQLSKLDYDPSDYFC